MPEAERPEYKLQSALQEIKRRLTLADFLARQPSNTPIFRQT